MLNTLAISAVVVGSAALVAAAAPTVIGAADATQKAATATNAAVRAVDAIVAPVALAQDRGIDPEDPRFGEAIGGTIARSTDAIRGAVRSAESEGYYASTEIWDEEQAVEACAVAAQRDAARSARIVAVDHVGDVDRRPDGWTIDGVVLARDDFRDRRPARWGFSCEVAEGRVVDVRIDGGDRWAAR